MYNGHKKYALFIGRWQPFHNGHKYLIDEALDQHTAVNRVGPDFSFRDSSVSRH